MPLFTFTVIVIPAIGILLLYRWFVLRQLSLLSCLATPDRAAVQYSTVQYVRMEVPE